MADVALPGPLDEWGRWLLEAAGTPGVPSRPAMALLAALAAFAVLYQPVWKVLRHVVTMTHEGGHAAMAAVTGRRLKGIRLHSDTSGVTVSSGRPTGPGVVLTLLGGYLAPAVLGLLAAGLVSLGWSVIVLWAALALLAALLLMIRNLFGVLTVAITGAVLVGVTGWAPPLVRADAGYLLAWFLLFAAPRPVLELQRSRRRGRAPASDADQLARLTPFPGGFWVAFFLVCTVSAMIAGSWLLLQVGQVTGG